jgi:hypothetical protein
MVAMEFLKFPHALLSMPCGWAELEMASQPFQGWSAPRKGGLLLYSTPLDTPRHTPMDMNDFQPIFFRTIESVMKCFKNMNLVYQLDDYSIESTKYSLLCCCNWC